MRKQAGTRQSVVWARWWDVCLGLLRLADVPDRTRARKPSRVTLRHFELQEGCAIQGLTRQGEGGGGYTCLIC
ncbi:hypothetical protein GGS24DRAFT_457080 [Hypoxylon argillaceum]|nr:hypothetical protein GGS24DRAFT_457080 [Hypoxylon argillaceum]